MSYTLFNIKYLAKNTGRYIRPEKKELFRLLKPGNYVQLMLRSTNNKPGFIGIEKIWVVIDQLISGQYHAKVITIPQVIKDLRIGDEIIFAYDYVLAARTRTSLTDRLDAGHSELRGVTANSIIRSGKSIRIAVREMPTLYKDSGWRFFHLESEMHQYPNQTQNILLNQMPLTRDQLDLPLGTILSIPEQKGILPALRSSRA